MSTHRVLAGALATLAWFALGLQLVLALWLTTDNGNSALYGLVVYFGFFTILTNLAIAIVCSAGALRGLRSRLYSPSMVGGATTAIVLVGLGYHFLLRSLWVPEGTQWLADAALHYAVPIGAMLHWIAYPHSVRLPASAPLTWCVYPVAYFIYALVRGVLMNVYPYPFIDVAVLGYGRVTLNAIGLLVAFVAVGYLVRAIANALARRVTPAATR
jgi:hypothetical protein